MSDIRKQVLGRGLSALLGPIGEDERESQKESSMTLSIQAIHPNPQQPRLHFSEEELTSLCESIREKGILQPILVRLHPHEKGKYQIVAGERRWRAAQKAGLTQIPVYIRDFSDKETLEVGLLENIQRQDLNPIEEAEGYRRLAEEFDHTQESLSRILGKSRSHIANTLRLLTLPQKVKQYLIEGKLSAGHGRSLIGNQNPEKLADLIVGRNLSVRQVETLSKKKGKKEIKINISQADPEKDILENQLSELLCVPVNLTLKGAGGTVTLTFKNPGELDEILKKLNSIPSPKAESPPFRISVI
jgi:ParB family chromosome partitioning protein